MRVIVAGHICLDLTPHLPAGIDIDPGALRQVGRMRVSAGGCVYNTGSALSELGLEVRVASRIGDDVLGDLLESQLRREGLDAELTRSDTEATSYSIVIERPGEDRSFWHHVGACAEFDGSDIVLDGAAALHLGYPSLLPALLADSGRPLIDLLGRARASGLATSVDLAVIDRATDDPHLDWPALLARMCALTDVFTPSIDDLRSVFGQAAPATRDDVVAQADWALSRGAAIVALSVGRAGSYLAVGDAVRLREAPATIRELATGWAGYRAWLPASPIDDVVTTNGAGDAHSAGFLAALLAGRDPLAAAHCAADTARARIQGLPIREPVSP